MPNYRFLLCDSLTDTVITELPAESATFGEVLNGPGAASVTTSLVQTAGRLTAVEPLKQALYVERDGVLLWGGIVWSANMDVAANGLTLNATGFWSLVRQRRITTTATFAGVDQALIAKSLVDTAQGVSGGYMRINTGSIAAVGVARDRTYYGFERKAVGEAIEQLASVRNGFDFAIRPAWETTFGIGGVVSQSIARNMTVSFPSTGRPTNIVLEAGTNIELVSATVDASTMVTTIHAKGEGEGELSLLLTTSNASLLGSYPLVEALLVLSDVKESSTLEAHARGALDVGKRPMVIPSVRIAGGTDPVLGTYVAGDQVRLRASYGLLEIDASYRITQWSASVDANGSETVDLNLAPLEVFSD